MPKDDKPRFWYEDNDQRVNELVKKKKYLMQKYHVINSVFLQKDVALQMRF